MDLCEQAISMALEKEEKYLALKYAEQPISIPKQKKLLLQIA